MDKKIFAIVFLVLALSGSALIRTDYIDAIGDSLKIKNLNSVYYVNYYATGSGTRTDPYTGWQTDIQSILDTGNVTVMFSDGWYSCDHKNTEGYIEYCLKVYNNTVIKGAGSTWITQDDGLKLHHFIINDGTYYSRQSSNVRIEGLSFYGNTGGLNYNSTVGTAAALWLSLGDNYIIDKITVSDFGEPGALVLLTKNSQIDNIQCYNSVFDTYYKGTCLWITGGDGKGRDNAIGSVTCKKVSRCMVLEDDAYFNTVDSIVAHTADAGALSVIDSKYNTVNSIIAEESGRALAISQGSRNLIVNSIIANHTTYQSILVDTDQDADLVIGNVMILNTATGIQLTDWGSYHISNAIFDTVTTAFNLGTTTNVTISNAIFKTVTTKYTGGGDSVFLINQNNIISGHLSGQFGKMNVSDTVTLNDISTGSNAGTDICIDASNNICACGSCA